MTIVILQQRDAQQVNLMGLQSSGVAGRMADVLTNKGFQTGSFSIDAENYILSGVSFPHNLS